MNQCTHGIQFVGIPTIKDVLTTWVPINVEHVLSNVDLHNFAEVLKKESVEARSLA